MSPESGTSINYALLITSVSFVSLSSKAATDIDMSTLDSFCVTATIDEVFGVATAYTDANDDKNCKNNIVNITRGICLENSLCIVTLLYKIESSPKLLEISTFCYKSGCLVLI
jgi:hypothetical protein